MVEPDSAEPIWKTTRSVFSGRPSSHPSRRQSDAGVGAAGVGADRGVDQAAAVVLGAPIAVSVGAITASDARPISAAKALKKHTLTNLYNSRPQWLVAAPAALVAVSAGVTAAEEAAAEARGGPHM